MDSDNIIETLGLWKIYGNNREVKAICDVNITIPRGKTTCLIGSSGSGKSTLLGMIGLLIYPTRGIVNLNNQSMDGYSEISLASIRRDIFGFIFQARYLLTHLTALENTRLPLLCKDISMKEASARAMEIIERLGLEKRVDFPVKELSGGEAQRVGIARALVAEPAVLVADEPSSSIDSKLTDEFLDLVSELKKERQLTVIMASHDPQIIEVADNKIGLKDGTVVRVD